MPNLKTITLVTNHTVVEGTLNDGVTRLEDLGLTVTWILLQPCHPLLTYTECRSISHTYEYEILDLLEKDAGHVDNVL